MVASGAAHVDTWQQVDWTQDPEADLSLDDRDDVLRLARRMGMHSPASASLAHGVPGASMFLVLRSSFSMKGPHRTWTELRLCRRDWPCRWDGQRAGRWSAVTRVEPSDDWRIDDGVWHVDVFLGDDVTYPDAATIVRAIHRGTLVDRRPNVSRFGPFITLAAELQRVDVNAIFSVERTSDGYDVRTSDGGSGDVLAVTINDGTVELRGIGRWIA